PPGLTNCSGDRVQRMMWDHVRRDSPGAFALKTPKRRFIAEPPEKIWRRRYAPIVEHAPCPMVLLDGLRQDRDGRNRLIVGMFEKCRRGRLSGADSRLPAQL